MKAQHKIVTFSLVALSLVAITWGIFYGVRAFRNQLHHHDGNQLRYLALSCESGEVLNNLYIEELLGLSSDMPPNFFHFNPKNAEKRLAGCPFIKKAHVKKIKPSVVYVDYQLREPMAYLADYTNTFIDAEGVLFPFYPFFTPKRLPEIRMGEESILSAKSIWGSQVKAERMALASDLLQKLAACCVLRIDLSKTESKSLGSREIVVLLQEKEGRHLLRLTPYHFQDEIIAYKRLKSTYFKARGGSWTIDLRLPELAFITKGEINE